MLTLYLDQGESIFGFPVSPLAYLFRTRKIAGQVLTSCTIDRLLTFTIFENLGYKIVCSETICGLSDNVTLIISMHEIIKKKNIWGETNINKLSTVVYKYEARSPIVLCRNIQMQDKNWVASQSHYPTFWRPNTLRVIYFSNQLKISPFLCTLAQLICTSI